MRPELPLPENWQGSRPVAGMQVRIKEHSWLAALAAKKLKAAKVALVFGKTIHLYNTGREEFLGNQKWLCHELVHVEQFRRYGALRFVWLYLVESLRKGYRGNRFEVEARAREQEPSILRRYIIQ